jgi:hypothetical protein
LSLQAVAQVVENTVEQAQEAEAGEQTIQVRLQAAFQYYFNHILCKLVQVVDHLLHLDIRQRHLQFLVRSLLQEVEDMVNLEDQVAEIMEHLEMELETQVDSLHQKETQEETLRMDVRREQAAEAERIAQELTEHLDLLHQQEVVETDQVLQQHSLDQQHQVMEHRDHQVLADIFLAVAQEELILQAHQDQEDMEAEAKQTVLLQLILEAVAEVETLAQVVVHQD